MDGQGFDQFAKMFAISAHRRSMIKLLAGSAVGGVLSALGVTRVSGACQGAGEACGSNDECCSAICSDGLCANAPVIGEIEGSESAAESVETSTGGEDPIPTEDPEADGSTGESAAVVAEVQEDEQPAPEPSPSPTGGGRVGVAAFEGTIVLPTAGSVTVTANSVAPDTACDSAFGIVSPISQGIFSSTKGQVGQSVDLGPFAAGASLVFALSPLGSPCATDTYLSTDPDHARIERSDDHHWRIFWEDLPPAHSDFDYDDFVVDLSLTPSDPCAALDCDDGNPCTVDTCENGSCLHTPVDCSALSGLCVDGVCNTNGACVATPKPDGTSCGPNGAACASGVCVPANAGFCPSTNNICLAKSDCSLGVHEDCCFNSPLATHVCTNTSCDPKNCRRCGNVCGAGTSCINGQCRKQRQSPTRVRGGLLAPVATGITLTLRHGYNDPTPTELMTCSSCGAPPHCHPSDGTCDGDSTGTCDVTGHCCPIGSELDHCGHQRFGLDVVPDSAKWGDGVILAPASGRITFATGECMGLSLDSGPHLTICHFGEFFVQSGRVATGDCLGKTAAGKDWIHLSLDDGKIHFGGEPSQPIAFVGGNKLEGRELMPDGSNAQPFPDVFPMVSSNRRRCRTR